MNLFGNTTRVSDKMSTFFGYDNVDGCEIKIKANKRKDIMLFVTNQDGLVERFVFSEEDKDTLNRFEIMMTSVFNIYATFSESYGIKQNLSTKSVECSVSDGAMRLIVAAVPGTGVVIAIRNEVTSALNKFVFSNEDQDIFGRFKLEFNRLVNNISNIKLPKNTEEAVNV